MRDVIGSAHMTQGNFTSFTMDRFGNINSALALNGGWTQVPSGVYLNTPEFTISVWIYPSGVGHWSRLIDFGNGQSDNIILSLSHGSSLQPYFEFYSGSNNVFHTISSKLIIINQWQFLTATFNGTNSTIYLNGTKIADSNAKSFTRPFNLSRSNCYIGKSNWPDNQYSSSYLDDLRFHNKSLNQEEINELMNSYQYETSLLLNFPYFWII
jgi:hypothetical protein